MVGIDIVDLSRIKPEDTRFMHYILTDEEYAVFESFKNEKRRTEYAGGRFAVKEAYFKASQDRKWLSVTVLNDPVGRPYIKECPEAEVSISHDGGYACAVVFLQKQQP